MCLVMYGEMKKKAMFVIGLLFPQHACHLMSTNFSKCYVLGRLRDEQLATWLRRRHNDDQGPPRRRRR